jgi:F-type H+-transporting ATPase subunit b
MIEAISAVFNVNALITAINVFILFFVAGYFGSGMAKGFLEKRRQAVTDARQAAADSVESAQKLKAEYEAKLASADSETKRIIDEAKATARHREELKDASAKAEADRILERAKVEAELEKKRVNDEIKQEIIDYASVAAKKLIADNIDAQYSDEVIRESLDGIGEGVWQN